MDSSTCVFSFFGFVVLFCSDIFFIISAYYVHSHTIKSRKILLLFFYLKKITKANIKKKFIIKFHSICAIPICINVFMWSLYILRIPTRQLYYSNLRQSQNSWLVQSCTCWVSSIILITHFTDGRLVESQP